MTRATHGTDAPARESALELAGTGMRRTGIDVIGDAPWGTHFCQFYATKDDLKDVLVPYFKAGLEADELCMWVTSPPLDVGEAWERAREGRAGCRIVPATWAHRDHPAHRLVPARRELRPGPGAPGMGDEARGRLGAGLRRPAPDRQHVLAREVGLAELRGLRGGRRQGARPVPDARPLHVFAGSLRRVGNGRRDQEPPVRAHQARWTLGGVRELRPAADAGRRWPSSASASPSRCRASATPSSPRTSRGASRA